MFDSCYMQVLKPLAAAREQAGMVRVFVQYISGEDLFGLTEPGIIRILESLPGIDTLTDYRYKYGRNPLLELPLAVNPSGCARCEPKLRTHFKRAHTHRSHACSHVAPLGRLATHTPAIGTPDSGALYLKQFVHSRSSQYRRMKQEWRTNVYLARCVFAHSRARFRLSFSRLLLSKLMLFHPHYLLVSIIVSYPFECAVRLSVLLCTDRKSRGWACTLLVLSRNIP